MFNKGLLKCTAGLVAGTTICIVLWKTRANIAITLRKVLSVNQHTKLVNLVSGAVDEDYRQTFKDMSVDTMIVHRDMKNHSHPVAAKNRCIANAFMRMFCTTIGSRLYSVSMSQTEYNVDEVGSRLYYNAKDLAIGSKRDKILHGDIIKMTDVDYYVNMKDYMKGHHLIIFTFVPTQVAGTVPEGNYCINAYDEVEVYMNGGAHYIHKLWDYESDHLVVDHWWGSCVYLIEKRMIDANHALILLNHVRTVYGPFGWFYDGKRLARRNFVYDGIVYCRSLQLINNRGIMLHSFAEPSSSTCATIHDDVFTAVRGRLQLAVKPAISDVERILRAENVEGAPVAAVILFKALTNSRFVRATPAPVTMSHPKEAYQTLAPLVMEDGKSTLRVVGPQYLTDIAHPARSLNNDVSCVQGRIDMVANTSNTYPPFYFTCMDEFLRHIVPDTEANTLAPYDLAYMYDKFKRPGQRRLMEASKHMMYFDEPFAVSSFQKAESYSKVTAPRNISTLPMDHNVRMGQYVYALSNHVIKNLHWYAFGRDPRTTCNIVHDKARRSVRIVAGDISRMDGSCGPFDQLLMNALYLRSFAKCYHKELERLQRMSADVRGFTQHDIYYRAINNTLSGRSDTSLRNTICNALRDYITLRQMGKTPKEAWDALGIYGGDDSLSFDVDPDILKKVWAKTGHVVKVDVFDVGQAVPFLGRVFVDPWTTSVCIADVPRQVRKLHLSASPAIVPNAVVLRRKAESFLVTDPVTPILSSWARAVLRVYPHDEISEARYRHLTNSDISYWSKFENPFEIPESYSHTIKVVTDMFNDKIDVAHWCQLLDEAQSIGALNLGLMYEEPVKVEVPAVVADTVVVPKTPPTRASEVKQIIKDANANIKAKTPNLKVNMQKTAKPPMPTTTKKIAGQVVTAATPANRCRYTERGQKCPRLNCTFQHT